MERVAITGLGVLSPLGRDSERMIAALVSGSSAIADIEAFDTSSCRSHRAAKLVDFDPEEYIDPGKLRRIDEVGCLAVASGKLALADGAIEPLTSASREVGVVLGTYTAGLHSTVDFLGGLIRGGPQNVSPMIFSNTVGNAPASLCALELGLKGGNVTVTNKEASSLAAVAYAVSLVRHQRLAAAVTGGVDDIEANFFRSHDRFRVLSPTDGHDETARPFDRERNGFVFGEGAFALLVESVAGAKARGATIYAEIAGVGGSSSPCGINRWPGDPSHLVSSMTAALDDAGLEPRDVSALFASANGTNELDSTESRAIRAVFGADGPPVVSLKGALGESGTSGAASVVAAIESVRRGQLPPTAGLREIDPECPVDASPEARTLRGNTILINSFASGGTNYSIVLHATRFG